VPSSHAGAVVARVLKLISARNLDQAEEVLREELDARGECAPLLALAAQISRRRRKLAEAEAWLERARAADASDILVVQEGAELALEKGDDLRAAQLFQDALDRRPSSYLASRLSRALVRLKEFERAVEVARQALERAPDEVWLLRSLAAAEAGRGQNDAAAAAYGRLLEIAPGDSFAYKELMRLRTVDNVPDEAAAALKGLLRTGDRRRNPHLHALAADRLRGAGRLGEAAAEYRSALELDPGNAYARAQLGFCYNRMGEGALAIEALGQAFLARPADHVVSRTLETLCRKNGRLEHLLHLVDEALKLHPGVRKLWGIRKRVARLLEEESR